jgi:aspartyl/glutamyl-tRNA(Asn/Gln) amidotransferase subunit A (EC 6.3.5.-)
MLAHEIRARVARGELSPLEVAEAYLRRVRELDPGLKAFLTLNERLLEEARRVERGLPLAGLLLAVKDNIATKGLRTTAGSRLLENFVPPYDATAVARLKAQGALVLGKTNLDEFGMGSSTEHSAFFPSKNPFDPSRVPGGSSGGSAAAVAADLAPLALGSDTGGSVRQPASFCGVYGLKPTYGRVSRFGLVAYASSLEGIGPMARSVRDLALLMDAMAGLDPMDATSLDLPPRFQEALEEPLPPLRLGVVREGLSGNSPGVERALEEALGVFQGLGFRVKEVSWPSLPLALAAYYILAPAEASSNLARYDGTLFGTRAEGEEVWQVVEAILVRLWPVGQAPGPGGHLRPLQRLLRGLLRPGPGLPRPPQGRGQGPLPGSGPPAPSHHPPPRLPPGGPAGPPGHVPGGPLHRGGQPDRPPRPLPPRRV